MSLPAGGQAERHRQFGFTDEHFAFVVGLVRERTGIVLADNKQDMVYGRLTRRLRALSLASFDDYVALLRSSAGAAELTAFTNALTTNLTSFFRESHHFDHLRDVVLPRLAERAAAGGDRRLRIWSAGCSSGEEAYSAAMVVLSALPQAERWDARILATDIDSSMVAHGREGLYDAERVARVPADLRRRFVEAVPGRSDRVRMAAPLRRIVAFKRLNLLGRWPMAGRFDVVFCRNVAIYFDKPTQATLHRRLAEILTDDGVLYIGHSETLAAATEVFRGHGRTIYCKA